MDRIALTGMEFYGYHGCLPEEMVKGQRFYIDAELFLDLRQAGKSDELGDTVNYAEVFEEIRQVVEGAPKQLIEAVAEAAVERVLMRFQMVDRVVLTVHKPEAPISGKFMDVAVTIERARK